MTEAEDKLVHRDGSPDCPACQDKRVHTAVDWAQFHPYVGHGYTKERGWSHPDLVPAQKSQKPTEVSV